MSEVATEKKTRKKRDEKPIQAFSKGSDGELVEIQTFPKNITRKDKAVAWAIKQATTGHIDILFYRSCGSFKATPQTVMEFKIE